MPIYSYACTNKQCNIEHTEVRNIPDRDEPSRCAICGSVSERQIESPPFILKGGGWSSTGYQKGRNKEVKE